MFVNNITRAMTTKLTLTMDETVEKFNNVLAKYKTELNK